MTSEKIYDLAIMGSGFAGLAAAKLAHERNLNFCVVAKDHGAIAHFGGTFDGDLGVSASQMQDFLEFFEIPNGGDGLEPISVVTPQGKIHQSAFAFKSHALPVDWQVASSVVLVTFSGLLDYPPTLLSAHLKSVFPALRSLSASFKDSISSSVSTVSISVMCFFI